MRLSKTLFLTIVVIVVVSSCSSRPNYPSPKVSGEFVVINVFDLLPGEPNFFSYGDKGNEVRFFVMRTQGRVISFFDACQTCYTKKLGYRYDDEYLYCRACDEHFRMDEIEKGVGGCYPIRLPGLLERGKYYIKISDIATMAGKF